MSLDIQKARRENLRWLILESLNSARPVGTSEHIILFAVEPLVSDLTHLELRREIDYLKERALIDVTKLAQDVWFCRLNRDGIDVVEHTVDCDVGIARPQKYW